MEKNVHSIDDTFKPEKTLEVEFCDTFGPRFTEPFNAVETDPAVQDAVNILQKASRAFPIARMFCQNLAAMKHPTYDFGSLESFLVERIKQLWNSSAFDEAFKYIKLLRLLNASSMWAFFGCSDMSAIKAKIPEVQEADAKLISKVSEFLLSKEPLSPITLGDLSPELLLKIVEEYSRKRDNMTPLEGLTVRFNRPLASLVFLCKMSGKPLAAKWMENRFGVRGSKEFKPFFLEEHAFPDKHFLNLVLSEVTSMWQSRAGILKKAESMRTARTQFWMRLLVKYCLMQ